MFFVENVLTRKGPLAVIWIAASWDKKLGKPAVLKTDINSIVSSILDGSIPKLALRLSGQLLLGMSRVYRRKTTYLHEDWAHFLSGVAILLEKPSKKQSNSLKVTEQLSETDFLNELVDPLDSFPIDDLNNIIPDLNGEDIEVARRISFDNLSIREDMSEGNDQLFDSPSPQRNQEEILEASIEPIAKRVPKRLFKVFIMDEKTQISKNSFNIPYSKKMKIPLLDIENKNHYEEDNLNKEESQANEVEEARYTEARVLSDQVSSELGIPFDEYESLNDNSGSFENVRDPIDYTEGLMDTLANRSKVSFNAVCNTDLAEKSNQFLALLALATKGNVRVKQENAYGEILIERINWF
eukprot:GHVP01059444.1.p1 GENE.GHVP01059444.1~~GHVP01059444.1.p1  ORF type:complete len:354 (+),score=82.52 GHVP01059444.1:8-1069(+)